TIPRRRFSTVLWAATALRRRCSTRSIPFRAGARILHCPRRAQREPRRIRWATAPIWRFPRKPLPERRLPPTLPLPKAVLTLRCPTRPQERRRPPRNSGSLLQPSGEGMETSPFFFVWARGLRASLFGLAI